MLVKTKGIVLNTIKYADNASIVAIYTHEFGRLAFAIRGLNNRKSKLRAALFQPLSIVEIDLNHNPKKEIQYIKDLRIAVPFTNIPYNPIKTSVALFIAELLYRILKHPVQDEGLFDYIEDSICTLDSCKVGLGNFHLAFLSGLTMQMGFTPELTETDDKTYFDMLNGVFVNNRPQHLHFIQGEAANNFKQLMQLDFEQLESIALSRKQRAEALDHFIEYFKLHIPDFYAMKSVDVMHKLWD